jgi:N,N'-diacetyllegionaminate synthase
VIEKHFTLDRNIEGPDHKASVAPAELEGMVHAVRNIERALGNGKKEASPSELKNIPVIRKSIIAAREIRAGEIFSEENLTVKRPGTGISPMRWDEVIGQRSSKDYKLDDLI